MLSNEIKRLKMKKIKFENLEKNILKLDTYRRITLRMSGDFLAFNFPSSLYIYHAWIWEDCLAGKKA